MSILRAVLLVPLLTTLASESFLLDPELLCSPMGRSAYQSPGTRPYALARHVDGSPRLELLPGSQLALPLRPDATTRLSFSIERDHAHTLLLADTDRDPQHGFGRMLSCDEDGAVRFFELESGIALTPGDQLDVELTLSLDKNGALTRIAAELTLASSTAPFAGRRGRRCPRAPCCS